MGKGRVSEVLKTWHAGSGHPTAIRNSTPANGPMTTVSFLWENTACNLNIARRGFGIPLHPIKYSIRVSQFYPRI